VGESTPPLKGEKEEGLSHNFRPGKGIAKKEEKKQSSSSIFKGRGIGGRWP